MRAMVVGCEFAAPAIVELHGDDFELTQVWVIARTHLNNLAGSKLQRREDQSFPNCITLLRLVDVVIRPSAAQRSILLVNTVADKRQRQIGDALRLPTSRMKP